MRHHRSVFLAACASLALVSGARAQPQIDIPVLVRRVGPAVVSLKVYNASGREIALGSGFFLPDGRIVTNAHVVEDGARAEIIGPDGAVLGTVTYAEALSNDVDIAVLPRLGRAPAGLTLAAALPSVGERIVAIGAPQGLTNTVSDGIVSAIRDMDGQRLVQISAPISSGSSGGPVLNARGEVVGVSVAVLDQGQNLNFAIPAVDVRRVASSSARRIAFSEAETDDRGGGGAVPLPEAGTAGVQSFRGQLQRGDRVLEQDGSLYDLYTFRGRAGQTVTVGMASDDFDTFLQVGRMDGGSFTLLESNDDARGTNSALQVTLPVNGEYAIRANSLEEGETGAYVLLVAGAQGISAAPPMAEAPPREGPRDRPREGGNVPEIPRIDGGRPGGSTAMPSLNAPGWTLAAEGNTYTDHFLRDRIQRSAPGVYFVWVRSTYRRVESNSSASAYDADISRKEVDCRNQRRRLHEWVLYYRGRQVFAYPPDPTDWEGWSGFEQRSNAAVCAYIQRNGL